MLDTREFLQAIGSPTRMTDGTIAWLRSLRTGDS
jgi:hypothetical protein